MMDKNRKIIITLIIIITILVILLAGVVIYFTIIQEQKSKKQPIVNNIDNNYQDDNQENSSNTVIDQAKEIEVQSFNLSFEIYAGTEKTSGQIKALLSTIENSNNREDKHKVRLSSTGITSAEQVDENKRYTVELYYDNDGYIEQIGITEFTGEPSIGNEEGGSSIEQVIFNSKFTPYVGEITGTDLEQLFQEILNSNATNPEHQITYTSNNLVEVSEFLETDKYMITLSYDDARYINSINIDKVM